MTHVDLFSGIGGFAYAARQVWGSDYRNVCFCDNNKFCQQVIKKQFGEDSLIYDDIKTLTKERLIADTTRERLCDEANKQIVEGKGGNELHAGKPRGVEQTTPDANGNGSQEPRTEQQAGGDRQPNETIADSKGGQPGQSPQPEGRQDTIRGNIQIDLLTGGFPCQPFSCAGKREGASDDRFLWPEMLRVIKELKPRWIIGENVTGILGMAQQDDESDLESETDNEGNGNGEIGADGIIWGIINDLEQAGYDVQTFVIPACAVNAPHRRDRVWIVANAINDGHSTQECGVLSSATGITEQDRTQHSPARESNRTTDGGGSVGFKKNESVADPNAPNTKGERNRGGTCQERRVHKRKVEQTECEGSQVGRESKGCFGKPEVMPNTENIRLQRGEQTDGSKGSQPNDKQLHGRNREWDRNWLEVASALCGVDDGLPIELDGFKLTKAGHRVERLKALGNAIVPQVAYEIMRGIAEIERRITMSKESEERLMVQGIENDARRWPEHGEIPPTHDELVKIKQNKELAQHEAETRRMVNVEHHRKMMDEMADDFKKEFYLHYGACSHPMLIFIRNWKPKEKHDSETNTRSN